MKYNEELFEVCGNGNKKRLKELIDEGININQVNDNGENCLFDATNYEHKEIVEILIKEGINIQQKNKWNKNCLFMICLSLTPKKKYFDININKEIIKYLIEKGIKIQKDKIYKSSLIDEDIKEYIKELEIKREVRDRYL